MTFEFEWFGLFSFLFWFSLGFFVLTESFCPGECESLLYLYAQESLLLSYQLRVIIRPFFDLITQNGSLKVTEQFL